MVMFFSLWALIAILMIAGIAYMIYDIPYREQIITAILSGLAMVMLITLTHK